jgi:hypothetical protein
MTEQSSSPTAEEIAALPENEFLELNRDCDRINAEYAFKEAGIDALSALGNGALATVAAFSTTPYAPIGAVLGAALAGVSVWKGIQALGRGVQSAAKSASADTVLHVLYQPERPGTLVRDAEPTGLVKQLPQSLRQNSR